MKNLISCVNREEVVISKIITSPYYSKLLEMGLYVGKTIQILYKAPFGDPLAILVGDYVLSIGKSEAATILVNSIEDEA